MVLAGPRKRSLINQFKFDGVLDRAHRTPLKQLVCFSEETCTALRQIFRGLVLPLGRVFRPRRRRVPIVALPGPVEIPRQRQYEPNPLT